MTLTSGMLLVLMPGDSAPISNLTLRGIDKTPAAEPLFDENTDNHAWKAIVIHDSRLNEGSAQNIASLHEQLGKDGMGYHFVINNGTGKPDGGIETGYRWQQQVPGDYVDGKAGTWFNENAIGICLIGDGSGQEFTAAQLKELVWLTRQLQDRFGIARHSIYLQIGSDGPQNVSHFPEVWFRTQLLSVSLP
jgi:N-acetyl-anhydromuramyl-L-alanine amidase AmpD